jgi:hypothetical protein
MLAVMADFQVQVHLALAVGAATLLGFWIVRGMVTRKLPLLVTDVNKCHDLLSSTTLAKRAPLNQRLVVAFGIENGFTTTNEEIHHRFRKEIKMSLERADNEFARKDLIKLISSSTLDFLRNCRDKRQPILLVNVVQIAVFQTVLAIFFSDVPRISNEDVVFITSKMHTLWFDSKSPRKMFLAQYFGRHSSIIQDRELLHQKLKAVFPSISKFETIPPSDNPLNVLLPAFIGLLGVVLLCTLEVRFRSCATDRTEYEKLFQLFLQDPDGRWYEEENGLSVQQIIAETLRLNPPTRRIYTQRGNKVIAVDIEQLHRTGEVWGENPLRWQPKRWGREGLDVVRTVEYIPFGGKVGRPAEISMCPSRIRGGPKLIALIVGALLGILGEGWELVENRDGRDDVSGNKPLRKEMDAYETLSLRHASVGAYQRV